MPVNTIRLDWCSKVNYDKDMKLNAVRISKRKGNRNESKVLNNDMKNFGKRQLFILMNKNLALPFQMIQL